MNRWIARAPVLPFAFAALAACTLPPAGKDGDNPPAAGGTLDSPPIIDALTLPSSASESNGEYVLYGTISFHDDDDTVHSIDVRILATAQTITIPASDLKKVESTPITISLNAALLGGAGAIELDITAVDSHGVASAPWKASVELL